VLLLALLATLVFADSNRPGPVPPTPAGGSRISFVRTSQNGTKRDVYVVNTDGSNQQQVTHDIYVEGSAFWSPNGKQIVLQASVAGTSTIVLLNINPDNTGGQGVQLTADVKADSVLPVWSPDGTKIAFQSKRNGGDYQVFVMDADGNNKKLVSDGKGFAGNPAWAPDGKRIVYVQGADSSPGGQRELMVASIDGGTPKQITDLKSSLGHPRWSPKGDLISVIQTLDQYDSPILTVKPDGNGLRTLIKGGLNSTQEFSPDGQYLTYYKIAPGQGENVYKADVTDGKEVVLSTGGVGSYLPAWSPDGKQLAWAHKDTEGENYRIVVANADGSNVRAVSQGDGDDYQPSWGVLK
jgi:Tol biopolymer transport system component